MKLEEIVTNVKANYEAKLKQVNQLIDATEKAKIELQQLFGALQLASEMKQLEDKEAEDLTLKAQPTQEVEESKTTSEKIIVDPE